MMFHKEKHSGLERNAWGRHRMSLLTWHNQLLFVQYPILRNRRLAYNLSSIRGQWVVFQIFTTQCTHRNISCSSLLQQRKVYRRLPLNYLGVDWKTTVANLSMSRGRGGYYATVERRNPWVQEPLYLETWNERRPSPRLSLGNQGEPQFFPQDHPILNNFKSHVWHVKDRDIWCNR